MTYLTHDEMLMVNGVIAVIALIALVVTIPVMKDNHRRAKAKKEKRAADQEGDPPTGF